jgi:HD-GYP domain-containing protein (c-di-GMP phosphodiesterase class II)
MSAVTQGKPPRGTHGLNTDGCPEVADLIRTGRPHPETSNTIEARRPNVSGQDVGQSLRQFGQVCVATLLVAGLPVAAVWWLRASGAVSSAAVGIGLGMCLSLAVSHIACLVWESRPGSEDLLFSELMIWGYLHRWRTQRRLASARELLGPISDAKPSALNGLGAKDPVTLLERLVARMETRDPYLHGHSRRVARHSWMIARRMGLSRAQVARIRTAAAIHDVGKINTSKTILHKAGPLTDEEYDVIKRHPGDGARMAALLHDTELTAIVRDHHERLDGSGYPNGLSGDEIPVGARIIAVADTFDAITSVRPYRSARTHGEAIEILKEEAGTKLDPLAVRAFCSHYAGRHSLVLWSAVAGLPERVLSWLGEGVAGVASMAKAVAVAALIGGAAVTSSTLALPAVKHQRTKPGSARAIVPRPQPAGSVRVGAILPAGAAPAPRHIGGGPCRLRPGCR